MTLLLSLMLAAATPLPTPVPAMPTDLSSVPVLEGWLGRRISPRWSEEVHEAYRKGGCSGARPYEGSNLLELDILFLLSGDGKLLKLAPVNVRCPSVESYVSKRIMGTLRNSYPKTGDAGPTWYRSQVRFLWSDAP
ncbi:MAG: hypothetical protein QHC40_00610 [Sphingobium sp.]|nr:hypothetical protein [Sphingobium sp.]